MKELKVYVPQDGPYGLEPEEPLNSARFRAFFVYKIFTYFYKNYLDRL